MTDVCATRRGLFIGAAASATAIATPARAFGPSLPPPATAELLDPFLPDALVKLGLAPADKLAGVAPIIVRRALDGEKPNYYVGWGEKEWNNGAVFSDERGARWAAAENWSCVRDITSEIASLTRMIEAHHVPSSAYDGDFVMLSVDNVIDALDAEDYLRDDERSWAWAAEPEEFHWDPAEALYEHLSDWFEEADAVIPDADLAPLATAWAAIVAKHGPSLTRYGEDHTRIVVYDWPEFEREKSKWGGRLALLQSAKERIKEDGPTATHLLHVTGLVARLARAILGAER